MAKAPKAKTARQVTRAALSDLLQDQDQVKEALAQMEDSDDFEVGGYRFIRSVEIDRILEEELESDEYILGCFNASFLASATGWPLALIEAAQKGDAYEALGKHIVQEGKVCDIARDYVSADGYGHYFATYDDHEHDIGPDWYGFRRD